MTAKAKRFKEALEWIDIALRKSAKSRIFAALEDAVQVSGSRLSVDDLISLYEGADYSSEGLKIAAECFRGDLQNPAAWELYHT